MKILSWELADSAPERARFLHEADITALLQHPGVVPVHDRGQLPDGRPWFTMQEVRGRTFRQVMASMHQDDAPAPWPVRRGVELLTRACEAVAYAHDRGVVHRDLKPDNLMLGEFGEVLVMDWGLAKRIRPNHGDHDGDHDDHAAPAPDRDHSHNPAPPGTPRSPPRTRSWARWRTCRPSARATATARTRRAATYTPWAPSSTSWWAGEDRTRARARRSGASS